MRKSNLTQQQVQQNMQQIQQSAQQIYRLKLEESKRIQESKNSQEIFIKIPNVIMEYSLRYNHIVLPVYMYSALHKSYEDNIVDTNIQSMSNTFEVCVDNRYSINKDVYDTIKFLCNDCYINISDIDSNNSSVTLNNNINNIDTIQNILFSQSFAPINMDIRKINKNAANLTNAIYDYSTNIQYEFLDTNIDNNFTIVTRKEFVYIMNYCRKHNFANKYNSRASKINAIDLFNVYCQLKFISNYAINVLSTYPFISIISISSKLSMSKSTLNKYLGWLEDLDMIKISKINKNSSSNVVFKIIDNWKDNELYPEIEGINFN